jgi:hypothetical protein
MQALEVDSQASTASGPAAAAHAAVRVQELHGASQETARAMLEAEERLALLREQFERTADPAVQGELADEALAQVERQLTLARQRRSRLDGLEGTLWARRNRLERFLIHTRGRAWWRARRELARGRGPAD